MYRKVLTAVNEHLNSEITAKYAVNLAQACGAKLYICFVAGKDQTDNEINSAGEAVKRIFIEAKKAGVDAEAITETGETCRKIGDIVRREQVDIVFLATRREDIEKRFYTGTTARRLSISLPCSVALVRIAHVGKIRPKEILVPLKARIGHIEERVYFTARIAQSFDSNVLLFHSPDPVTKFFQGEVHLTPLEWEEKLPRDISDFMERMRRFDIAYAGRAVPGKAGRVITIEAFARRHDLIIMGASERSLLSRILRGNPVEEVLRNTPCDLIILKPRIKN